MRSVLLLQCRTISHAVAAVLLVMPYRCLGCAWLRGCCACALSSTADVCLFMSMQDGNCAGVCLLPTALCFLCQVWTLVRVCRACVHTSSGRRLALPALQGYHAPRHQGTLVPTLLRCLSLLLRTVHACCSLDCSRGFFVACVCLWGVGCVFVSKGWGVGVVLCVVVGVRPFTCCCRY